MANTAKGYPYPVGTDRVMDGDDAIKALAEAIEADANVSRATTVGHSLTGGAATAVQWNAASPNGCALTKTSATVWTITKAGLYVMTAQAYTTGFQPVGQRSYMQLVVTAPSMVHTHRQSFAGENTTSCTVACACAPGDTITFSMQPYAGTTCAADTGILEVMRLGRT